MIPVKFGNHGNRESFQSNYIVKYVLIFHDNWWRTYTARTIPSLCTASGLQRVVRVDPQCIPGSMGVWPTVCLFTLFEAGQVIVLSKMYGIFQSNAHYDRPMP